MTKLKPHREFQILPTGNYSRLSVDFEFRPQVNKFIWQLYLPSVIIVTISWLLFWLHPERRRIERAILVVATILSMISINTIFSSSSNNSASNACLTLADQWILVCSLFIFGLFVEYIIVSIITTKTQEMNMNENVNESGDWVIKNQNFSSQSKSQSLLMRYRESSGTDTDNMVDSISRILFPLCFIVYLVIYLIKVINLY